ncbi:MAG: gamma-glutamyltransferase [Acidimicrobiales bacterium]
MVEPGAAPAHTHTHKQPVVASQAAVATNHPLASAAALEMLAEGGNAVDAAVTALFALTVVEPMMVGITGSGFFVHRTAAGAVVTLDDYGTVPAAARPDMFEPVPGSLEHETVADRNTVGHLAATVPGALAGWCEMLRTHGTVPLARAVAPALRYAEHGFVVSPYLAQAIAESPQLAEQPAAAAVWTPGGAGRGLAHGTRIHQPDYARTLRTIADGGPDALYAGELGDLLVAEMERADASTAVHGLMGGGPWITRDDLTGYRTHWRQPVRGSYRGFGVTSMPPASSGGTHVVQILNLLEGFDVAGMGFGSVAGVHHFIEALKLAFADRTEYLADPETVTVPVEWLTSKAYADARRRDIAGGRATEFAAGGAPRTDGEGSCTTHLTVVDVDGGVVATTQTLNALFGARTMVTGAGMMLNNCMALMDPVPGRTNSIAPGKRVLSSMSPTIVERHGQPWFALGTPGGNRIFAAVTQAILNVVDHGMSLQQAVEAPRVWTMGRGSTVLVEDTFPDLTELVAGLERLGHGVEVVDKVAGGMNGVLIDEDGLRHGAACWRADGSPAGLSGGPARMSSTALDRGR